MHDKPCDGDDPARRDWMARAACLAGGLAATGLLPALAGAQQSRPRALLVDFRGEPIAASRIRPGEPWLFNYPFVASPVFLIALEREAPGAELQTEAQQRYASPAGVGPTRTLVAYSAICSHKLMYPTPALSFIGVRKGLAGEPSQVIHCCGDNSRYDPTQGARVMSGPAPQPLAAVLLEWDARTDRLHAVGLRGGEMFKAFFEKYAFKLETEVGRRAFEPCGATTVAKPASEFSRQWQSCKAG